MLTISWAITFSMYVRNEVVVSGLKTKVSELYDRNDLTLSLCKSKHKPIKELKTKIKFLKRSLTAVRRDVWSKENIARLKKQKKNHKLYGKGGDCE